MKLIQNSLIDSRKKSICVGLSTTLMVGVSWAQRPAAPTPSVRIVYSAGMPVEQMKQTVADPNAYTCPTPKGSGVTEVVQGVAKKLRERGISVETIPVAEVRDSATLTTPAVLVLAGSCHFGRGDWGLKRLVDERIGGLIYSGRGTELAKPRIFAIGHSEGGEGFSQAPIQLISGALKEANIQLAGSFTTLDHVRWTDTQREEAATAIANRIADTLNSK